MKGSLHTDELMSAVVAHEGGIRTERRISHCFIMDVPGHADPLIVTDAAVNIVPDLEAKVDIIQNAIDLAHAMGAGTPGTVGTSGATTVALLENGDAGKKANEDVAAHVTVLSRQSKSEPRAWRAPPRRAPTAIDRSTTNQTSPFCTRARPPTTARAWRHSRARRSILSATSICRRASLSDAGGDGGSGGGSVLCVVLTARQARRTKSIRSGGRGKPCARMRRFWLCASGETCSAR